MQIMPERDFELSDESSTAASTDVLGLWRVATPATGVPFVVPPSTTPDVPLWTVDLPADPAEAGRHLASCDARLHASSRRLAEVPGLLDVALDRRRSDVTFAAATSVPETGVDVELVGWLRRVARGCGTAARVETRIQGELVAWSLLGLAGNMRVVCRPELGPYGTLPHRDSVRLVVESRAALLRVVACVTRGAVAISVRLALPGGAVLALPAACRFVRQLLAEVDDGRAHTPPARTP
jgi:hypothetical protein